MDCCNYGEYRGQAQYGAGAGWDYGHGYPPTPYTPYPHTYYPHAHDYARYYRYDYPAHPMHHADHVMPTDYGAYALKDARARRTLTRREQRAHPTLQHFPVSHTPPLECGMNSRGHGYCEPQNMWSHYQMGVLAGNGWNGSNGGMWSSRVPANICARDTMRYGPDCRLMKNSQSHIAPHDGRSTPYPVYDQGSYEKCKRANVSDIPTHCTPPTEATQPVRDSTSSKPRSPPQEIRPPVVPLPAFQQAFGSTEIGKFAEAFSRTEITRPDESCESFAYEPFNEWDGSPEPQWTPPAAREIKCEHNF